jgi:DNA transposition AAA+ family ATPase
MPQQLTLEQKREVTQAVLSWIDETNPARSGAKLAEKAGINAAYLSQIKAGKYRIEMRNEGKAVEIKDSYFQRIADAIGMSLDNSLHWDFIDNFKRVTRACRKAQKTVIRMVIDTTTGMGKTHALEHYAATNDYVLYVKCTRNMGSKDLLDEILIALGVHDNIRGNHSKLKTIRNIITNRKGYAMIFDEVEQVKPGIYDILKDVADWSHNKAAVIISGMGIIQKFDKLANNGKPGFPQLRRRFFGHRVMLNNKLSHEEIIEVCEYEKIANKGAQNLLAQYVTDLDMLAQYVRDMKEWQESNGKKITAPEAAELLEISYTTFKRQTA